MAVLTKPQAESLLSRFAGKRVLVIGDLMADEYVWGHAGRISPEAPVLVLDAARETFVPGGAANTANQLITLGATVFVAGAVGKDAAGERLVDAMQTAGANVSAIVQTTDRPTTQKTRIVAGAQQLVRIDREKRGPLPSGMANKLLAQASELLAHCDALLFSDYIKGVISRDLVQKLLPVARQHNVVVTANPKPASAKYYSGIDLAQFNRVEADETARTHDFDSSDDKTFHSAGTKLRATLGLKNMIVTRSADGLTVFKEAGDWNDVPPHRVEVFDGTGAGDSTIAGTTLALASGASVLEAVAIGNAAGGAVVRKVGVVTATRDEIAALFS